MMYSSRQLSPLGSSTSSSSASTPSPHRISSRRKPSGETSHGSALEGQQMQESNWQYEGWPYHRCGSDPSRARRIRYAPSRLSAHAPRHTQKVYAKAILDSMPAKGGPRIWHKGVRGSAVTFWEVDKAMFPEEQTEEIATLLMKYSEMFGYLSRLYERSVAQSSPLRTEQIIRRGKEILAAVRLLASQATHLEYPARGMEPRNMSRVSVWGWKPSREMDLVERVTERRRIRALEARAISRSRKRSKSEPQGTDSMHASFDGPRLTKRVSHESGQETRGTEVPPLKSWAEEELEKSYERRARSLERVSREHHRDSPSPAQSIVIGSDPPCPPHQADAAFSAPEGPSPTQLHRETINWHYPVYNDGYDIPDVPLPSPRYDNCLIASASSGKDLQQVHMIRNPPGSLPRYLCPPSEPVSPKTVPVSAPPAAEKTVSSDEQGSTELSPYPVSHSTESTKPRDSGYDEPPSKITNYYSTDSGTSKSARLRKLRLPFKNLSVSFPRIRRPLWTSGSGREQSVSDEASSSLLQRRERKVRLLRIKTSKGIMSFPASPSPETKKVSILNNTITTSEVVVPSSPEVATNSGNDVLTRTEREYQELLDTLQQLKKELRMEREINRKDGARNRSRGRRIERASTPPSVGRSRSRDTVSKWLGETPL